MKQLEQFGIIPFSTKALKMLLKEYHSPNDKISKLMADGDIIQIKKGLYVVSEKYRKEKISKEIIANSMYGPSYISMDYALSFYGLIPEKVIMISSVTTKRAKHYSTVFNDFEYIHCDKNYFPIGITQQKVGNHNFLIATKEKALCDKIVFTKNLKLTSISSIEDFLLNDLRMDAEQLKYFNKTIIKHCIASGHKQKELKLLVNAIKKME